MNPFDRYLHAVITRAQLEASDDGSATVEAPHLLLAVAAEPEPVTRGVLDSLGLDAAAVRQALNREFEHSLSVVGVSRTSYELPRPSRMPARPSMGTSAKLVLERAFTTYRKKELRPAHVLLGLLSAQVGTVPRALALAGVDREDALERLRRALAEAED